MQKLPVSTLVQQMIDDQLATARASKRKKSNLSA